MVENNAFTFHLIYVFNLGTLYLENEGDLRHLSGGVGETTFFQKDVSNGIPTASKVPGHVANLKEEELG